MLYVGIWKSYQKHRVGETKESKGILLSHLSVEKKIKNKKDVLRDKQQTDI